MKKGLHKRKSQRAANVQRAIRAALIVGCSSALLIALCVFSSAPKQTAEHAFGTESIPQRLMSSIATGQELSIDENPLPLWFADEFFPVDGCSNVHVNQNETVISLSAEGSACDVASRIQEMMRQKGWMAVSGGMDGLSTMIRKEGDHTWALLSCFEGNGQSIVVVQTEALQ